LWFPKFEEERASIVDMIELFKKGRNNAHAFMNWQSKEQLEMEYILNAEATVIDKNTVEVNGERFTTKNIVLGTGTRTYLPPEISGLDKAGVYDFSTPDRPGPGLRADQLCDHRRFQGRHGVRLVLPGHRLPDDDPHPQPTDAHPQPAPRGRGPAHLCRGQHAAARHGHHRRLHAT